MPASADCILFSICRVIVGWLLARAWLAPLRRRAEPAQLSRSLAEASVEFSSSLAGGQQELSRSFTGPDQPVCPKLTRR